MKMRKARSPQLKRSARSAMRPDPRYKSSIPPSATERVVERYKDGDRQLARYFVDGQLVGSRFWDDDGYLSLERPCNKDGLTHGVEYSWYFDGVLTSAAPWVNGKPHGVAKQWSQSGKLVGSYKMTHGTGIDLFWNAICGVDAAGYYLSEVHYMQDGQFHGYTWRFNDDRASVWWEEHYVRGLRHGIERRWNEHGRLSRGFPRYFVDGKRVDKRKYLRAAAADPSLPRFRAKDNSPARKFPDEIRKHLLTQRDCG
jgi:antitoxin component YwqK of YwqJK toxin-antitoxin module